MKEVSNRLSFSQMEEEILQFWRSENIFQISIDERPKDNLQLLRRTSIRNRRIHLLAGTIKDVIPRYKP